MVSFSTRRKTTEEFYGEIEELTEGEYTFTGEYKNNKTKMSAKHNSCGFVFSVTPHNFLSVFKLRKGGCPKCGTKRTKQSRRKSPSDFISEFETMFGNEYILLSSYVNSRTKIKIKHKICGNIYEAVPNNLLTKGSRCGFCYSSSKYSKGETSIYEFLQKYNLRFEREYRFDECKYINSLPFDFAVFDSKGEIVSLIEYDGEQHFNERSFFGGKEGLFERRRNDKIKDDYCNSNSIKLIRIPYWEFRNIDSILTEKLLKNMLIPSEAV